MGEVSDTIEGKEMRAVGMVMYVPYSTGRVEYN